MLLFILLFAFLQDQTPTKPSREFEVSTKYELKKKPMTETPKVVFVTPEERTKESGTDMLPYLIINLKVKKWNQDVTQIRVVDSQGKIHLKKKVKDEDEFTWDMGYVDDMKDKVTSGKFIVQFIAEKQPVEQITIQVEEDGTFLVNGEKRGKF
jgi:hypothetical protein